MNAHGQDVPQVEKRADQFNSTDQSCIEILSLHTPVKSNLPSESKWIHIVRMYRKQKGEQTTLISHRFSPLLNVRHAEISEKEHTSCE